MSTTPPGDPAEGRAGASAAGPDGPAGRHRARRVGRHLGAGARATGRGARGAAVATGRVSRWTLHQARRAARAEGAGESGLSRLIEMHAFNTAGDAAVAVSLAGTLFFQVPTGEARGQVALFLALTMLPFAVVAPLIGPFLDRFSRGRRWAMGLTMALRAVLCWELASAVVHDSAALFPAAFGVLVASKAYGVTRAAAVPRLVPRHVTLVAANARLSLAGIVGVAVSAPLAAGASTLGPEWSLRYGVVLFVAATALAIMLPEQVDSHPGGARTPGAAPERAPDPAPGPGPTGTRPLPAGPTAPRRRRTPRAPMPAAVAFALRANAGPRFLAGFVVMFMAFLLREQPIPGWRPAILLALVLGGLGLGNAAGLFVGALLRRVDPSLLVVLALAADTLVVAAAAVFYNVGLLALLGLTTGLTQALAKLALDSTIQRDVPPQVHSSAFARSDATLQLAWVVGGLVGIALPLVPHLGLGVAAAVLAAWSVLVLVRGPRPRVRSREAAPV